jgi:hypothetical protein
VRADAGQDGSARRVRDEFAERLGPSSVFFDDQSIRPGSQWDASIRQGLDDARALVLVMTPAWRESVLPKLEREGEVVRREVLTARAAGKLVVPMLLGASTPQIINTPHFPLLEEVQWLSVSDAHSATLIGMKVDEVIEDVVAADLDRLSLVGKMSLVDGIADLLEMQGGHRRALAITAAASRGGPSRPHEWVAGLIALVDPQRGAPALAVVGRPDGLLGILLDLREIAQIEQDMAAVRAIRRRLSPLLNSVAQTRSSLDIALAHAVDAVLDRATWNVERSGTGSPTRLVLAKELIDRSSPEERRRFRAVTRFIANDVVRTSDPRLRDHLADVQPWRAANTRQRTGRRRGNPRNRHR